MAPIAPSSPSASFWKLVNLSLLNLLLQDTLQRDCVGGKLADALTKLVGCHGVLVEVEAEEGFVVDIRDLLDVKTGGCTGVEFLGYVVLAVVEVFEEIWLEVKGGTVSKMLSTRL